MRTHRNLPGLLVDFPTVVNNLFDEDIFTPMRRNFGSKLPAVNIAEDVNNYGVEVMAPGFEKENFNIKVEHNQLIISAEMNNEKNEKHDGYTHREFNTTSFKRTFNLPESEIDEDAISANYVNGILKVVLPKREEAKPKEPKTIAIH